VDHYSTPPRVYGISIRSIGSGEGIRSRKKSISFRAGTSGLLLPERHERDFEGLFSFEASPRSMYLVSTEPGLVIEENFLLRIEIRDLRSLCPAYSPHAPHCVNELCS